MNLCLDIGNTRAKIGLFDGSQLLQFWSIPRTEIMEFPKTLTNHSIKNVILSTVAQDVGEEIRQMWGDPINFIELNEKTALPIQ
ncbi:MAG: type III pantothenate kinase, partial [Cyanothece sp. SIO1E1]|nr:type III pantothenate kinase [Cyanothece sp. SIO1E1]